jgi:hypothetical protein
MSIVNIEFCSLLVNEIKSKLQYWFCEPYNGVPWNQEPTHKEFAS